MSNLRSSIALVPHKLTLILALLLCTVCAAAQDKTLAERPIAEAPSFAKRALVIGVGEYEHAARLAPYTQNDAKAFAELLKKRFGLPDEAITVMTDALGSPDALRPTYVHLRSAMNSLIDGVTEKTEVIVYFSGHGKRDEDQDWLVPLDGDPTDVKGTCVSYADFHNRLETRNPRRALIVLDACRNLDGGKGASGSGFGAGVGFKSPQFAELFSCQPKQVSQLGKTSDFSESVFTHFLLVGLSGDVEAQENGLVTFESLKDFVQGKVSQYVARNYGGLVQLPVGRASGKMVLARGGAGTEYNNPTTAKGAGRRLAGAIRPREALAGDTWINPKDGAVMIFIPAGPFLMGDDDDVIKDYILNVRNNPRHTVTLTGYWIYKELITVGMYKRYCQETGKLMPPEPEFPAGNKFNAGWSKEDHPIVNVSWNDAVGYCAWAGVALPTEAQWEKAARGTDGRKFPWGDTFDLNKVWAHRATSGDAGGTAPVGKYGVSPYGCTDMAGNVWQWCADRYDAGFWGSRQAEGADPVNQSVGEQKYRVLRGGSWLYAEAYYFRASFRRSNGAYLRYLFFHGFRCAAGL